MSVNNNESEVEVPRSRKLRPILLAQTRLLDGLIHQLANDTEKLPEIPEVVRNVTILMIQALGVSAHSALKLTEERDMAIRDCFGMARSAIEIAVNICLIVASGEEVAKRAMRHAMQKAFRDLHRKGEIGGINFEVKLERVPLACDIPGMAEAIAEFTQRNGRELRDWTPVDMSSRIEKVRESNSSAALSLSGANIAIYSHSSEILHGTYFGVVHFWSGSGEPATSREVFFDRWEEHFDFLGDIFRDGCRSRTSIFAATSVGISNSCAGPATSRSQRNLRLQTASRTRPRSTAGNCVARERPSAR